MKKRIVGLFVVLFCVAVAHAQRLDFGAKIGANMTKINGQSFSDAYRLSYQVGFYGEIDFTKGIGIQPELLFSQSTSSVDTNGFKSVYQDAASNLLKKDVKLNYLNIPVLLRLNAGRFLTFNVGPQFSILMNNNQNLLANSKDAFKKGDFSAVLGAQINVSKLRIYGRYNIGLANISDADNANKWKNQQLQIGVGFTLL